MAGIRPAAKGKAIGSPSASSPDCRAGQPRHGLQLSGASAIPAVCAVVEPPRKTCLTRVCVQ